MKLDPLLGSGATVMWGMWKSGSVYRSEWVGAATVVASGRRRR
ncbi:MAG: hypothetical protein V1790_05220 [Planctomycetota bacterium]